MSNGLSISEQVRVRHTSNFEMARFYSSAPGEGFLSPFGAEGTPATNVSNYFIVVVILYPQASVDFSAGLCSNVYKYGRLCVRTLPVSNNPMWNWGPSRF